MHWLYSTCSAVALSNHENSECTIHTFTRENKIKQETFSQKVQLEVLWLQVGCAILYSEHGCTYFPKIYMKTQNSIGGNTMKSKIHTQAQPYKILSPAICTHLTTSTD
jgi:hypothetical protein